MSKTPPDADENDVSVRRRIIGFFMFPVALFPMLAILSYDWHCIAELCIPPQEPTTNLIGPLGDWFAYTGYQLMGLALWTVPALCAFAGLLLAGGRPFHVRRRITAFALFAVSAACLLQLAGAHPPAASVLAQLNIRPNAGGAIGYMLMTRGLARIISPFGAGLVMAGVLAFSVVLAIGIGNIVGALARLTAWAADREAQRDASEEAASKADAIATALAARNEAKAARLAEKQRAAEEKAAAKAEREAAREELRRQREEERKAREAAREAERLKREEARKAEEAERARLQAQHEQEVADLKAARLRETGGDLFGNRDKGGVQDFFPARGEAPKPVVKPVRSVTKPEPLPAGQVSVVGTAKAAPAPEPEPVEDKGPYLLPPVSLLDEVPPQSENGEDTEAMANRLIDTLKQFEVNAQLAYCVAGPVVTQYALALDIGTRVERVSGLQRNIQMALQATSLRIEAPIPGKNAVGIEVPNQKPASVRFREIIDGALWQKNSPGKFQVPLLLGKDAAGNDLVVDLAKLPHLLVAGATGQGKSVCLNSIINGLLMCRTPDQLRFIMVDPKRVEFTTYNKLPHLLVPVINDTKKVVFGLRWAVVEMEKRLKMFARVGVRNIVDFNTRKKVVQPDMFGGEDESMEGSDAPATIPYIVIVIDEVADIMQAAQKEVEPVIARLTALARATGIHLILATQRPDTKVITGTIKSNIPGRIAFKTSSSIDSRTILDATGSEQLIGKGDMLFKMADGRLLRAQGSYISDDEINRIIAFIGEHSNVQFDENLTRRLDKIKEADPAESLDEEDEEGDAPSAPSEPAEPLAAPTGNGMPAPAGMTQSKEDQLYRRALEVLRDTKRASVSHLQRRMGIGYNHAARLVDLLEERGVIGTARGAGPREILLDPEALLNESAGAEGAAPAEGAIPDGESQPPDALPEAMPPDASAGDPFGGSL